MIIFIEIIFLVLVHYSYAIKFEASSQPSGNLSNTTIAVSYDTLMRNLGSLALNKHMRYENITFKNALSLRPNRNIQNNHDNMYPAELFHNSSLHVFIAITSSPTHSHLRESSRNSWLLPCILNPTCDYRFFVDISKAKINLNFALELETHRDIVIRDECSRMRKYPNEMHYGNAPPVKENIIQTDHVLTFVEEVQRIFYKIDWKVSEPSSGITH